MKVKAKLSFFERICTIFSHFPSIPFPKDIKKRIQEEIVFCHLSVKEDDVLKVVVYLPIFSFSFLVLFFFFLGILDLVFALFSALLGFFLFYYFLNYTKFLSIYTRAKASAEMSSAIIFMALSLQLTPNLERAVAFASENLLGPLGQDLKELLWGIKTGKVQNIYEGLKDFSRKWRKESEEFQDALALLISSLEEPPELAKATLQKAVDVILEGDKRRMKSYSLKMKTPLQVITMFGVLFPTLLMSFLPTLSFFLPEIIRPSYFAFVYLVFIPFLLLIFLSEYRMAKPEIYHHTLLHETEEFAKKTRLAGIVSFCIFMPLFAFFFYKLITLPQVFVFSSFFFGLGCIISVGAALLLFSSIIYFSFRKKNEEIYVIEEELPTLVSELALISSRGMPIEKSLEELTSRLSSEMRSKRMIEETVERIKKFPSSLKEIILGENGVLKDVPSKIVRITFRVIVATAEKGSLFLSTVLERLSSFLRQLKEVSFFLEETLADIFSETELTVKLLLPISAGGIVGMIAIVYYVLFKVSTLLGGMHFLNVSGEMSSIPFLFSLSAKYIPFHWLEVIIGLYMIELIVLLTWFFGEIRFGEDRVGILKYLASTLALGITIYSVLSSGIYLFLINVVGALV